MTRFARARGSKSSNERVPEEATPWHIMKQQLQKKQGQKQESTVETAAKTYLRFTESEASGSTWAEFENSKSRKQTKLSPTTHQSVNDPETKHKKKKKDVLHQITDESSKVTKKLSKKLRKDSKIKDTISSPSVMKEYPKDGKAQVNNKKSVGIKFKNVLNPLADSSEVSSSKDVSSGNKKYKAFHGDTKKKFKNKPNFKKSKFMDAKGKSKNQWRRKPEDSSSETMFINGKEIEVMKYDGFPVKKEDAIRLQELRTNLKAKGIPHESIVITMKLERRRAEKALARERKKVCFHCRKSGHNLSDCPELTQTNENESGICFKCGSTEHTHFQCKVSRGDDFRYASCFICKEQGHIARQCPDNPRGLYPKGGACKICGAVTHLKKDCPDLIKEKEEQTITLKTLNAGPLEALEDDLNNAQSSSVVKKPKKKKAVKF